MRKWILPVLIFSLIALVSGCREKQTVSPERIQEGNVSVQKMEGYYMVTMDLSPNYSRRQTGKNYGKAVIKIEPDFEHIYDSYIKEIAGETPFDAYLMRIQDIKSSLPKDYVEEIEGLASACSGTENAPGDGRLSEDELFFTALLPDVGRWTQCSAVSVFGDLSSTKETITGRNLDWYIGSERQLAKIHAVTLINNQDKSICLIGFLGYLGCITGFNDNHVFAAMLDSSSGQPYSSAGKRSYSFDMRSALENLTSLEEIADDLTDSHKNYAFNHLFFLSDENKSLVLENNFSGNGTDMKRALRSDDSELNDSVSWGFDNAVAAVNSFLLRGNHDNHTESPGNYQRWNSLKSQVAEKAPDGISLDEIKAIISFDNGDGPGIGKDGDLYVSANVQTIIFQPSTYRFEVAFAPSDSPLPTDPVFKLIFDANPFR